MSPRNGRWEWVGAAPTRSTASPRGSGVEPLVYLPLQPPDLRF